MSIAPISSAAPAAASRPQPHEPSAVTPPPPPVVNPAVGGADSDGDNDGSKGTRIDVTA